MDQIVTDLDELKISVEERPKRSAMKQLFYMSSEKKFLEGEREKVAAIRENLQIRDRREITGILNHIKENVRKQTILLASMEQHQRDKAAADVLENLERAHGASYRSRYVEEKAQLHPGTRKRILDEVPDWARSPSQDRRVQVIYGAAGAGKSAIARAVSEALAESGHLGASFFFLRGDPECSNPYLVFPTIAYQLAHSRPNLMTGIVSAIRRYTQHGQTQGILSSSTASIRRHSAHMH
ncbi:hypothetical protein CERSUDRAFT_136933 [Gelatoporia subvermispora B]|uniref:Nephrocystin 3-like N-terminal domain-containing protein n=1 Tax=Ceriporiopsis subvermispora (strain B) TaxID=914234 RepID=M2QI06_CERS8|nr:hypothetical protein CERSUDRAFT_136933 [Gelatoporia subvermispora B]